jgi:hypothetical protein
VKKIAMNSHSHAELRPAYFLPGEVKRDPRNILFSFGYGWCLFADVMSLFNHAWIHTGLPTGKGNRQLSAVEHANPKFLGQD